MRLLALALLLLAAPATGQTAIRPGDAALTGQGVTAGERTLTIRLVEPIQQDAGTLTERTTIADDQITRVTTVNVPMAGQSQTDSTVASWPGLAPVSHRSRSAERTLDLAFTPTGVTGTTTPAGGAAEPVDAAFDEPLFDSAWASEAIQSLPLAPGYTATLAAYDTDDGPTEVAVAVTGRDDVATSAGPVAAFVVEMTTAGRTSTFAISEATREVLRMRFSPQPGVTIEVVPQESGE